MMIPCILYHVQSTYDIVDKTLMLIVLHMLYQFGHLYIVTPKGKLRPAVLVDHMKDIPIWITTTKTSPKSDRRFKCYAHKFHISVNKFGIVCLILMRF